MELYVEKDFLDNFSIEFDKGRPTQGQKILATILEEYGDVEWFIDTEIKTPEDLETLQSNYFFARRSDYKAPIGVLSLKDELFERSQFKQTLVFTNTEKEWFEEAETKGALCFSYDNYENRILEIIANCHYKIDLSEQFGSWECFKSLQNLPFNHLLINDNYILTDSSQQLIDLNIIPLLRTLMRNKKANTTIDIFTSDLKPISTKKSHVKEAAKKRYKRLNDEFPDSNKLIRIINNDLQRYKFDLHDRVLLTNFYSIDSGKGFNLFPYKKSNSQIIVETIFNKYTYNRLRNHLKIYKDYLDKIPHYEETYFTIYPS